MIEIKFRAWGKNSKEFLTPDGKVYGLTLKQIQNIHDLDVWELTQYTGLKDKNGKEIYEGDILQYFKDHEHNPQNKYIVDVVKWEKQGWYPYRLEENAEIIGNIYENPELLTK